MSGVASTELPAWARVSSEREAHIHRVTALIERWAAAMHIEPAEREAWRDAAFYHDALRDAPAGELRAIVGDIDLPDAFLHGPAAAQLLASQGEKRTDVLEAIRWHTVGCTGWARTGRALYMADFLEPGRPFDRAERAALAARVPTGFEDALRLVVRERIRWTLREGLEIPARTVAFWNGLQGRG